LKRQELPSAPPRSIHRKLSVVLSEARAGKTLTIDDLVQRIQAAGHSDFTRYLSEDGRVRVVACSAAVIRRTVHLARELGLLDESGRLSASGVKAVADVPSFNKTVSRAVEAGMLELGVSSNDLNEQLRDGLARASIDSVPSVDNLVRIFRAHGADAKLLRRYLQLLSTCGGVATVRKKLYLPRR
jgi:hypothetical protein